MKKNNNKNIFSKIEKIACVLLDTIYKKLQKSTLELSADHFTISTEDMNNFLKISALLCKILSVKEKSVLSKEDCAINQNKYQIDNNDIDIINKFLLKYNQTEVKDDKRE